MKVGYANGLQNHYNACYSDFAKKSLGKNHLGRCFSPRPQLQKFREHIEDLKLKEPNLYIFWQTAFAKDPLLERFIKSDCL